MKRTLQVTPGICVVCLSTYNSGGLHGAWIDVTDVDTVQEEIQTMLKSSPAEHAEKWIILYYNGFGSLKIEKDASIEDVVNFARFIDQHGDFGAQVLAHFGALEEAKDALENCYHGCASSELDFARDLFDDCYLNELPKHLRNYIDYDAFSHDLFMWDYFSIEYVGETHIFSNC